MGDRMIQGKTLLMRDAIYIGTLLASCIITYMTTAGVADEALRLANENKAFGMAREEKIDEAREYARDYAYRKDAEIKIEVKSNTSEIHAIREENVETRVKMSHLEKNQEKMLSILEDLNNKK